MATLRISGDTSGYIDLRAPTTGAANVFTFPATTGTILTNVSDIATSQLPTGSVLQVVNATYSTTTLVASTSASDTGLSASITPTSASSKILVITSQTVRMYRSNNTVLFGYMRLLRDSTGLLSGESHYEQQNLSGYMAFQQSFVVLDSPATTSSITYKTQGRVSTTSDGSSITFQPDNSPATITLMEIAA